MPKEVQRDFAPGDLVFAKVKGYPPWPARVNSVSADDRIPKGRVPIFFYGTYETYNVGVKDIFPYADYKDKYGKEGKRAAFNRGLYEIEHEPHIDPRSELSSASVKNSDSKAANNLKNVKPERKGKRPAPKEEAIAELNAVDRDDDKDDGDDNDNEPLSLVRQAGAAAVAASQPLAASVKIATPRARGRPKAAAAVCRSIDSPSASQSSVDAASTDSEVVANVGLSSCSPNEESASNDASASSVSSRSDDRHLKDQPQAKRRRVNPVGKAAKGRRVTPSVKLERLSLSPSPDKKDIGSALPGSVLLSADHTSGASDVNRSTATAKQTRLRASRLRRRESASPVRRQAASPSVSETERAASENSSASSVKNEPSDKAVIVTKRARGRPRRTVPEVTPPRALKRTATAVAAETQAEEAPKRSRRAARKLPTPDTAPTSPTSNKAPLGNEDGDSLSRVTLDVGAPGAGVDVVTTEASVPAGDPVSDSTDSSRLHCEETTVPAVEASAPVGEVAAAADVATATGGHETPEASSAAAAVQALHPVGSGDLPSHLNSAGNTPETVVTKSCVDLANPSLNGSHDVGGSTTSHEKLHKSHHSVKRKKQSEERQVKAKTTEERLDGGSRKRAFTEAEDGLAAAPEVPSVAEPKVPRVDEKKEKKRTVSSDEQANHPKQEKLRAQMEKQLITIDTTIKTSLTVANKDVPKCLAAMDELSGMKLIPSVLGKHSEIVDTIRKCRKYKGDALVQQKAEHLCMKLSTVIASDKDLIELFKKRSLRDVEVKKKEPPAAKHEELPADVEHNTGQPGADPQGSEISTLESKDVESATCEAIAVHDSNVIDASPTFSSAQSAPAVGHPEPAACPRASSIDESVTQVVPSADAVDAIPPSSSAVSARLNRDDLLKALGYLKGEHSLPQQAGKKDETSVAHFTSANDRAPSTALGTVADDHRSVLSTKPLELTAGTASSGERELDLDSRIQQLTKMAGPLDVKIKPASHKSRHHGSGSSVSSREDHRRDERQRKKASSRSSVASFTVERDMLRHAKAKKAADPDKIIDDDELHSLLGV